MRKACVVAAVFFLFVRLYSEADRSTVTLSVDDAVQLAKENNVSISRGKITLAAAERAKNHSWNSASPTASIGADFTLPTDDSNYDYSVSVNARISVSLSANLYTSLNSAKIAYESGKLTFDDAVRSVELSVREAFCGLLYEKEYIVLQEHNLEIAKTQYESNRAKYNQGRMSEIDVLSAEVNYKSRIPTVESARTTYQNDIDSFKQMIGLSFDDDIELSGALEQFVSELDVSFDGIEINSATVALLEYKLASAKNAVLDKRFSAYAPSLSAGWTWRNSWTKPDANGSNPSSSSSVTLSASIPLDGFLPWSVRNDAVDSAVDTVGDLELQLADAKKDVLRAVNSGLRSVRQSQESLKYRKANVELAQKTYTMTAEAYNRGTKDLLTLQNANTSLLNAEVSLKNEMLSFIKTVLKLEKEVGVPFGTLLKSNSQKNYSE